MFEFILIVIATSIVWSIVRKIIISNKQRTVFNISWKNFKEIEPEIINFIKNYNLNFNIDDIIYNAKVGFLAQQNERIYEESLDIVNKSKKIDTVLPRLSLMLEQLLHLAYMQNFYRYKTKEILPKKLVDLWNIKHCLIYDTHARLFNEELDKIPKLKTKTGQIKRWNRLLDSVTIYSTEYPHEFYEELIIKIQHEINELL